MSKPREWEIECLPEKSSWIYGEWCERTKVIEMSAYQALEATEEGWRKKAREAMSERDAIAEKLRIAVEALKLYRCGLIEDDYGRTFDMATEALAKIGGAE